VNIQKWTFMKKADFYTPKQMETLLAKNFDKMDEATQKRVVAYLEQLSPIDQHAK